MLRSILDTSKNKEQPNIVECVGKPFWDRHWQPRSTHT
jgi:hypothetical protein